MHTRGSATHRRQEGEATPLAIAAETGEKPGPCRQGVTQPFKQRASQHLLQRRRTWGAQDAVKSGTRDRTIHFHEALGVMSTDAGRRWWGRGCGRGGELMHMGTELELYKTKELCAQTVVMVTQRVNVPELCTLTQLKC